jgi:hypothetical protein
MDRIESAGYVSVFEARAQVFWNLQPTLFATFKRFLLYSRNNIRARLFHQWQAKILLRYAVLAILLIAALRFEPAWVWVPIAAWLLMLMARAVISIRRNRICYPASFLRNVKRTAMVMSLLAVLDAAAIIGSVQWLLLDSFRWSKKTPVEAGDGA